MGAVSGCGWGCVHMSHLHKLLAWALPVLATVEHSSACIKAAVPMHVLLPCKHRLRHQLGLGDRGGAYGGHVVLFFFVGSWVLGQPDEACHVAGRV